MVSSSDAVPDVGFSGELAQLFVAAGNPTLKSVASAVATRGHAAGVTVSTGLYVRLGEWRSGKHTPREFDAVVTLVLAELLDRARARDALDGIPVRMDQWRGLWQRAIAAQNTAGSVATSSPFPGLASYTTADAARFFGRDAAITAIDEHVDAALRSGGGVVAVVGVSGAGKSSVLAAGVTPRLVGRGVGVLSMNPGAHPSRYLADALGIEHLDAADAVADAVESWARSHQTDRVVLVVDQAEELFTAAEEQERRAFLRIIAALARPDADRGADAVSVAVVVGLRADFMARWSDYPVVREALNRHMFVLGPMTRDQLSAAITGPLAGAGLSMEPGLAEHIVVELCGPGDDDYEAGLLPLLNHALAATWRHRQGSKLTLRSYREAGGVAGALTETAEAMWSRLDESGRDAVRRILLRLVHLGEGGTRDTRQTRPRAEVVDRLPAPAGEDALTALIDSRLVSVTDDGEVSVVHEIVLDAWPRLRSWIDDDRAALLTLQKLQLATDAWRDADRDRSHLYRGAQLSGALEAIEDSDGALSGSSEEFLDASRDAVRKESRLRVFGVAALVCVTVAALVLSVVAFRAGSTADAQRRAAEDSQLQARSDQLQTTDPTTSAQLSLLAYQQNPSPANRARLVVAANLPLARSVATGGGAMYTLAISPDGQHLAAASSDDIARVWAVRDREVTGEPVLLRGHESFLTSVAWSPDSRRLATTADDGTARIWRIAENGSGTVEHILRGHVGRVVFAAWSPDGTRLVTAGMDATVRVWDAATGGQLAVLTGHRADVRTVAWSPDGRLIASGGSDETARLWDARTYAPIATLTGHTKIVHSVEFSHDSRTLVTGSDDTTVRLWDITDPRSPQQIGQPLARHSGPIWSTAFSGDDRQLLVASLDGTATVWDISTPSAPTLLGEPLAGSASSIYTAAFFPGDDHTVMTGSADGVLRTWSLPPAVLPGHAARVITPAMAGNRMASADYDGTLNLWDVSSPDRPRLLDTHRDPAGNSIYEVALSPDARLVAVATTARVVEIYRIDDAGHLGAVSSLPVDTLDQQHAAFSPDGRTLAISADDRTFQLWNVADPAHPVAQGRLQHDPTGSSWATARAWSPDSKRMVTVGADHRLSLWDVRDPDSPRRLAITSADGSSDSLNAVAFSADGHTVATGGDDGIIALWTVDGTTLRPRARAVYLSHNTIRTLTFTEHGSRLVVAGDGQSVTLWDTSSADRIEPLGGSLSLPGDGRWYATASPDGRVVAAGGDNGALQLTLLDTGQARARICASTTPLSREQWTQNVPEKIGYHPPCQ